MPKKRVSPAEELFAKQIDFAGYLFEREYKACPDRRWRYDFYLPQFSVIVEIEGVTFGFQGGRHQTAMGYTLDCEKYNWLVSNGYALLRFTPNMVKGTAKSGTKKKIEPAIDTLDRYVLGWCFDTTDRTTGGYVRKFIDHRLGGSS